MRLIGLVTPEQGDTPAVAKVSQMSGNVLVKPASQTEWRPLQFNTLLCIGDLVYVSEQSKLVFTYTEEKAKITVGENSLLEVTQKPTLLSKMFRNFYKTPSIGEKKLNSGERAPLRKNRIYVKMEQAPTLEPSANPQANQPPPSNPPNEGFSVERIAKLLRIAEPKGDVKLISSESVAGLFVRLKPTEEKKKIFGYLWRKQSSPRPIWSSITESNLFPEIPLPSHGEFVFQAISEDDEYISPIINITFSKPEGLDFKSVLKKEFNPENWSGKQVLVFK